MGVFHKRIKDARKELGEGDFDRPILIANVRLKSDKKLETNLQNFHNALEAHYNELRRFVEMCEQKNKKGAEEMLDTAVASLSVMGSSLKVIRKLIEFEE